MSALGGSSKDKPEPEGLDEVVSGIVPGRRSFESRTPMDGPADGPWWRPFALLWFMVNHPNLGYLLAFLAMAISVFGLAAALAQS